MLDGQSGYLSEVGDVEKMSADAVRLLTDESLYDSFSTVATAEGIGKLYNSESNGQIPELLQVCSGQVEDGGPGKSMKKYDWESEFELSALSRELVDMALKEDIGEGDFSTLWSVPENHVSLARIIARAGGVIAGFPVVKHIMSQFDPQPVILSFLPDGQAITAGQVVAEIEGSTRHLLSMERTVLNFMQRLSGVGNVGAPFCRERGGYRGQGARYP